MVDRKRPPIVVFIILLMVALVGFYGVTQRPSFELYRTVDIVQLLGSGACFGAAMVGVIVSVLRRR
jgi:drug/metabolite transporter (DMT)-like permease